MGAFEARMHAMWEKSDKLHQERMERIDRRLDATAKLLQQGARVLAQVIESQREFAASLRTLPRNGHKQPKKT
jgi:hypothetical protein